MNLHINLLSVNERMNSTYVKLVKDDFTENRWSKRQSRINNLCEVTSITDFPKVFDWKPCMFATIEAIITKSKRVVHAETDSEPCFTCAWLKALWGATKHSQLFNLMKEHPRLSFSVRELIHESRTKAAVMAEDTWRCAAAISTALILIL